MKTSCERKTTREQGLRVTQLMYAPSEHHSSKVCIRHGGSWRIWCPRNGNRSDMRSIELNTEDSYDKWEFGANKLRLLAANTLSKPKSIQLINCLFILLLSIWLFARRSRMPSDGGCCKSFCLASRARLYAYRPKTTIESAAKMANNLVFSFSVEDRHARMLGSATNWSTTPALAHGCHCYSEFGS